MLIHWLWLATREGLGDRGRRQLMELFGDAEDIYYAQIRDTDELSGIAAETLASLCDKDLTACEKIVDDCAREDIRILTWQDAAYPARLKNIADPPVVLYYRGTLPQWDARPLIGVVGTRKASAYGLNTAKRLGWQIASCGGIVVSGMAGGVDAMAMRGALSADASVVGVLGCGADVVYPKSNRALFDDVIAQGCILTEFPPGTPPIGWNFPRRNRIISGLSCGVLVIEAPEKSGALITARQAADQGRDVFVVPGNIDVDTCAGSNALLRDGAIAVGNGWDVLSEYEALYPGKLRKSAGKYRQSVFPEELEQTQSELLSVAQQPKTPKKKRRKDAKPQKSLDKSERPTYIDEDAPMPPLREDEARLVALLRKGVTLVDDIIAQTDVGAAQVNACLTMLELKGVLRRLPGKRVELTIRETE